jgi:serine/threonine protein kinase
MTSIIMDFYPHTLRSVNDDPHYLLSLKQKLTILSQLALALVWLADNQVCHRDIKPENITLNVNRVPKIVDFGSCCPSYRGNRTVAFQVTETRRISDFTQSLPPNTTLCDSNRHQSIYVNASTIRATTSSINSSMLTVSAKLCRRYW